MTNLFQKFIKNWVEITMPVIPEVNTKTFYLSGTSDLTTAQAVLDYYNWDNNPIISYADKVYTISYVWNDHIDFIENKVEHTTSSWDTTISQWKITINFSSSTVNSVVISSEDIATVKKQFVVVSQLPEVAQADEDKVYILWPTWDWNDKYEEWVVTYQPGWHFESASTIEHDFVEFTSSSENPVWNTNHTITNKYVWINNLSYSGEWWYIDDSDGSQKDVAFQYMTMPYIWTIDDTPYMWWVPTIYQYEASWSFDVYYSDSPLTWVEWWKQWVKIWETSDIVVSDSTPADEDVLRKETFNDGCYNDTYKYYNGHNWVVIESVEYNSLPPYMGLNDNWRLWFDTTNNILKYYDHNNGHKWKPVWWIVSDAWDWIVINANWEISVDTTFVQEKLTAWTNVQISNANVISATDTTYNAGEWIEIWTVQDYSAMQWPAPDGFHVPLNTEWQAVKNIRTALGGWSSAWTNFGIALKLPFAGSRFRLDSNVSGQGGSGHYWSSSRESANNAYYLYFYSTAIRPQYGYVRACGLSVRCFKNTPTIPTSSWTKLYWTSIESWWIFWSSTDWLISLSSNWTTWITIMDKNLWATTVWNSGDTLSEANCGYYYQRWNNYGFPRTWSVTTSSTQVDASTYWPWNYYSSSTFITRSSDPYRWDTTDNWNLWWWETWVVTLNNVINNTGVLSVNGQTGDVTIQTGWTYTAWDWIDIDANNVISVDSTYMSWYIPRSNGIRPDNLADSVLYYGEYLNWWVTTALWLASDQIGVKANIDQQNRNRAYLEYYNWAVDLYLSDTVSGTSTTAMYKSTGIESTAGWTTETFEFQWTWNDKIARLKDVPSYTAWTWLTLSGTEFSADTTVLATKADIANLWGFTVVDTLPSVSSADEKTIYLLGPIWTGADKYEEWIVVNNQPWFVSDGNMTMRTVSWTNQDRYVTIVDDSSPAVYWAIDNYTMSWDEDRFAIYTWTSDNAFDSGDDQMPYIFYQWEPEAISGVWLKSWDGTFSSSISFYTSNAPITWSQWWKVWTKIWETSIDLSWYATTSALTSWLATKQDTLTVWTNIQIATDGTISATDTTYSAWTGIGIDANNQISNTLPWPVVSATAPANPIEWSLWYDTTNDVLKSYDWTNWNECWWSNTKTFLISWSDSEKVAIAQEARDWQSVSWNLAIVKYLWYSYIYRKTITTWQEYTHYFSRWVLYNNSSKKLEEQCVKFICNSDRYTVSSFATQDYDCKLKDLNTKTFDFLNETQAILDWYLAGNTPIVIFSNKTYFLKTATSSALTFQTYKVADFVRTSSDKSWLSQATLIINYSWTTVTTTGQQYEDVIWWRWLIMTDYDYSTPYTPQYDWSPATKKYVDDKTAVVSGTAPSNPVQWQMWYDTTTDILKTYDWTNWNVTSDFPWMTILSYGHNTWQDFLDAYNRNAIVYCRASSNSNPWTWVQWRMAFMAFVGFSWTTPTNVEFQYYRSRSDHNTQANELDEVYVYKLENTKWWKWTVTARNTAAKTVAWTWISLGWWSGNMTITNSLPGATVSTTEPSSPTKWMQWYDSANDVLKIYNWTEWKTLAYAV